MNPTNRKTSFIDLKKRPVVAAPQARRTGRTAAQPVSRPASTRPATGTSASTPATRLIKGRHLLAIAGYLLFMGFAVQLPVIDRLVQIVSTADGQSVFASAEAVQALGPATPKVRPVHPMTRPSQVFAGTLISTGSATVSTERVAPTAGGAVGVMSQLGGELSVSGVRPAGLAITPATGMAPAATGNGRAAPGSTDVLTPLTPIQSSNDVTTLSIPSLIREIGSKPWEYDAALDRYVVHMDACTKVVLTLRPALQRRVEKLFTQGSCRLGVGIVQDPLSGAILAMASFDGQSTLSVLSTAYRQDNWALKSVFPPASLMKIITAAAALERRQVGVQSNIHVGRRTTLEFWRAFAMSHNTIFSKIGNLVGASSMVQYCKAFGFNRPFFFDLPVTQSSLQIPGDAGGLGRVSCGLERTLRISPVHVASIVSTILNRGKMQKPYLVEKVLRNGNVVFTRKPFTLSQPIRHDTAQAVYQMMMTTTTHGTGRRGFNAFQDCPDLANLSGGKTGTLTGIDPKYFFTWFGGFTKAAGRDLTIVTLVGQSGSGGLKAATLAGRFAHELFVTFGRRDAQPVQQASR